MPTTPKRRVDGLASPAVHAPEREGRMGDDWGKWERAAGEGRNALTFARPRARGWWLTGRRPGRGRGASTPGTLGSLR
jgi:hypothetical protein